MGVSLWDAFILFFQTGDPKWLKDISVLSHGTHIDPMLPYEWLGYIAIPIVVALFGGLVAFVGAGIYAAGYTIYVGFYNLVTLIAHMAKPRKRR